MPSKKKKYNARFPAVSTKIINESGCELFVESLLTKSAQITQTRNAKTLTPSHMKQCILSESRFDFLKDLVKNIPDATTQEDSEMLPLEIPDYPSEPQNLSMSAPVEPAPVPIEAQIDTDLALKLSRDITPQMGLNLVNRPTPKLDFTPNFYTEQGTSSKATTVIQYGSPARKPSNTPKIDFSIKSLVQKDTEDSVEPKIHIDLTNIIRQPCSDVPPLIPIARGNLYTHQNNSDNLCIDEDYDN
ncbi:Negative Cofactor 2alpha [Carabus blaptoides fortunei]